MSTCKLCKGTRYLGGVEAMGRCICVTPAAMLALEAELDQTTAENEERYGEMDEASLRYLRQRIDAYLIQHEGKPHKWTMADAEAALRNYMHEQGHPHMPVGTTGSPALDRLVEILT